MIPSAPRTLAALIGREAELAELERRVAGGARLSTVVGPPGIGKTRLAAELHRALGGAEPNAESAWVELSTARSVEELCARVGHEMGMRLSWIEPHDLVAELGWALEGRGDTTLFLDEADRCLDALREVLSRWLSMGSTVRIVVTSRERLGIPGEVTFELAPLGLGGADDRSAVQSPAGRLLLERAGSGAEADDERSLAALIRALEGIPLAIELAAARLSLITPGEMLERWGGQLDLLSGARPHGMSLRGALESSWRLLSAPERRALTACSIFTGSFALDAAEAVAGAASLDALSALRDKSLIAREPHGPRLRLYGPVRAFAEEHREEHLPQAADLHAAHFASVAKRELARRDEPTALTSLTTELDDLRAAFARGEGLSEADRASLALAIATVLVTRGPPLEALSVLDAVSTDGSAPEIALLRGRALEVAGRIEAAIPCFEIALGSDRVELVARAYAAIAGAELARGDVAASAAAAERALEVAPPSSLARVGALRAAGVLAHAQGDLDGAGAAYEEARATALELQARQPAARLRADIGAVRLQQHRLEEAEEHVTQALEELDERTDPIARALAEGNLAILLQERGELDRAEALYRRGVSGLRRAGHRLYTAHLLGYAGALAHERGDVEAAIERYQEATASLRKVGDARLLALVASLRGAAEASRDRLEAADEAFAEATLALERGADPGVSLAVEIHRHHLRMARARDEGGVQDALRREVVAACEAFSDDETLRRSDDARLALRLLRRSLRLGALSYDEETSVLTLPDGTRVDFENRAVLRRLLEALISRRRATPGSPLDPDALLAAGWPGESPKGQSGMNRVKVSLSSLRKLGLRDLLQRSEGGYFLDPAVPLGD